MHGGKGPLGFSGARLAVLVSSVLTLAAMFGALAQKCLAMPLDHAAPTALDVDRGIDRDRHHDARLTRDIDDLMPRAQVAAAPEPPRAVTPLPYLSSAFGWRRHPITRRHSLHEGLDFAAPHGTPIVASASGVVLSARMQPGYGRMVEIDHGRGLVTRYAHASQLLVKPGQAVRRGQLIARVGSSGLATGPHLHFEVRVDGRPVDPRIFLGRRPTAPPATASSSTRN
jgi:murein DD-endopeptidase MepM/ murein hydrolase activator NlpD